MFIYPVTSIVTAKHNKRIYIIKNKAGYSDNIIISYAMK